MKLTRSVVNRSTVGMFPPRKYGKEFVNEMARLILLYGDVFAIDTPKRMARFFAHVRAEVRVTRSGASMRECLDYRAEALPLVPFRVFQKKSNHKKPNKLALRYGRTPDHPSDPQMIANIAYANRNGNGDIDSGDGWRYRGVGALQSTGKKNILRDLRYIHERTGIRLIDPESGEVYPGALDSTTVGILLGMANWRRTGMHRAKSFDDTIDIINRYTSSRPDRHRYLARAKRIIARAAA